MSGADFRRPELGSGSQSSVESATAAISSVTSFAQESASAAGGVASKTAATLMDDFRQLLNEQVRTGADKLGYVARSIRRAADDLEPNAPLLAGAVRSVASKTDDYAGVIRHQSVDQIWHSAAEATRRQPALVFGLAALAGFFVLRTVRNTPPAKAPSIQPDQPGGGARNLHV